MEIYGLDHVQLAMPVGHEEQARAFYSGVLGLTEQPKPANLVGRGGVWFVGGTLKLHLGVEADFRATKKAHPALLVRDVESAAAECAAAGYLAVSDEALEGFKRVYVEDPFGNRVELLEAVML